MGGILLILQNQIVSLVPSVAPYFNTVVAILNTTDVYFPTNTEGYFCVNIPKEQIFSIIKFSTFWTVFLFNQNTNAINQVVELVIAELESQIVNAIIVNTNCLNSDCRSKLVTEVNRLINQTNTGSQYKKNIKNVTNEIDKFLNSTFKQGTDKKYCTNTTVADIITKRNSLKNKVLNQFKTNALRKEFSKQLDKYISFSTTPQNSTKLVQNPFDFTQKYFAAVGKYTKDLQLFKNNQKKSKIVFKNAPKIARSIPKTSDQTKSLSSEEHKKFSIKFNIDISTIKM